MARGILDALGCILAGRDDPAVDPVRRVLPEDEALIDAAAATAHDYDDTHLPTVIHATPPVAAAVFRWRENTGQAGQSCCTRSSSAWRRAAAWEAP